MTKNKGVALILTVIILTAVLAIALTAGKIFTDKIKMSRNTSDSMKAYYAAESGIEWALYQYKTTGSLPGCPGAPECIKTIDGAEYEIKIVDGTIKAIGKAGEARRGIEVEVALAAGPTGPSFYWTQENFNGAGAKNACQSGYHICNVTDAEYNGEWLDREYNINASGAISSIFSLAETYPQSNYGRIAWVNYSGPDGGNCKNWTSPDSSDVGAIYRLCNFWLCLTLGGSGASHIMGNGDGCTTCNNDCSIKHRVLCCSD